MDNKYLGKKVNMKEVQCYNYQEFGYYARDCRRKKKAKEKDNDEMQYAHAGDSDYGVVLLMANIQSENEQTNMWYLDSRYSNHMTGNKNLFTKLDDSVKKVIKFAYDRHVTSKETCMWLKRMVEKLASLMCYMYLR